MRETATEALRAVATELEKRSLVTTLAEEPGKLKLTVAPGQPEEFVYGVRMRRYETPGYSFFESQSNRKRADYYYRAEIYLLDGGQNYDVMEFSKEELIQDVLEQYERHFQYLHAIRA